MQRESDYVDHLARRLQVDEERLVTSDEDYDRQHLSYIIRHDGNNDQIGSADVNEELVRRRLKREPVVWRLSAEPCLFHPGVPLSMRRNVRFKIVCIY